jgi:hypothetical protein
MRFDYTADLHWSGPLNIAGKNLRDARHFQDHRQSLVCLENIGNRQERPRRNRALLLLLDLALLLDLQLLLRYHSIFSKIII